MTRDMQFPSGVNPTPETDRYGVDYPQDGAADSRGCRSGIVLQIRFMLVNCVCRFRNGSKPPGAESPQVTRRLVLLLLTALLSGQIAGMLLAEEIRGPADLRREFISPRDHTKQPYRLYLPPAYDGTRAIPLLVALHGTGGDENKYFDHETYHQGIYKREAEKRGIAILCPLGNDSLGRPTEWRGIGELHVLAALEDVQRLVRIDPERIVCTGQSMGGTGTTYLCCRYPDLFAAGIPLASTYGHVSLAVNLQHVPFLFVQGADDWPIYAATGPIPLSQEMKRLKYNVELWMVPEVGHNTMGVSTERVLDWALEQQRVAHPRQITHRTYFPLHGRAWGIEIQELTRPGWYAEVQASIEEDNTLRLRTSNTSRLVIRPDPELLDVNKPIKLKVGQGENEDQFSVLSGPDNQLELYWNEQIVEVQILPRQESTAVELGRMPIAVIEEPPTWEGEAETTLGNWLTDAMRDISGADIAILTKGHYRYGDNPRGAQVEAGQTVDTIDLINWLRPGDAALAQFTIRGAELLEILEENIRDKPAEHRFLVQVSGCRYRFDRKRSAGMRIVESDIDPERTYTIVCNSSSITRTDTLHLGDRHGKLNHEILEPNILSTAWYYAQKKGGRIRGELDGRLVEE